MSDVYFNAKRLPKPKWEYVAFIDIMGTQTHMKHNVNTTANYIFKLHAAILAAWRNEKYKNVFVYPVMDGAYITASQKEDIEKILIRIFSEIAKVLISETNPAYRFLIRGAIAYGKTIHGHHVPYSASKVFETDLAYKNNILLGSAMIDAYKAESEAAPFGIFVSDSATKREHESNRKFGAFPKDWKWFTSEALKIDTTRLEKLPSKIDDYFECLKDEDNPLHYDKEKIEKHQLSAEQYFSTPK